jgi:hypothetical protein
MTAVLRHSGLTISGPVKGLDLRLNLLSGNFQAKKAERIAPFRLAL